MRRAVTAIALAAALLSGGRASSAAANGEGGTSEPPRVVPMPEPPRGPVIRRVVHDARGPVTPGARVGVTVYTEKGSKVTVDLGATITDVPCAAGAADASTFTCSIEVPAGVKGPQRLRARAIDAGGRASTLSATLPVEVEAPDPWKAANAANRRMIPAFFAAGSAALSAEAKAALAANLERVTEDAGMTIVVEGRCDASERGDRRRLSEKRAEAARDHLVSLGIPPGRIRIAALADAQPLTASRDDDERAVNRSVLVVLQPPGTAP